MKIALVTPAPARARNGNRGTAVRWAGMLRELGHKVSLQVDWDGRPADLLLALHARRSHGSIRNFAVCCPDQPIVLALTGTDLYRDIRHDPEAQASLPLARRMIVLQDMGLLELAPALRRKTYVVFQSAQTVKKPPPLKSCFEVVVSGHLREEKDPFRAVAALTHLPPHSRIRVTHIGGALSPALAREAQAWMKREPRYRWLGEVSHGKALGLLARSRLMVISSRMEGGANVVSEALANRVPVIASRISGNIGMLGRDYVGYYPTEDEKALAKLLARAQAEPAFLRHLAAQCRARKPFTAHAMERAALRRALDGIS
ncbi:MAG: TIGR04348 family glycosyltransferase [Betaproteobacteria bacterium]|nr:TIGR04348 family glycosyltransferase [Betaproteobacteria bacterium]